ncbi:9596_t:CDS:10 [Funneliformis geosporum]|uniref:Flavin-containing monooxygenase 1 n=1 Tax=Funneliformis geosporum TaxID=1117311 RepID=A0A9W4WXC4_9GLOM|nr:9596_t:CDS:10 [Funneliformis geosporum]
MEKRRVAIIGAGPSGLTSIKQCLDDNLEPVCFEASDHTGGLWRYMEVNEKNKDPHSSIYQSVVINTSKEVMAFTDFPVPYEWPSFLHNKFVVKYFDMYAEKFKLLPYIKFNSPIQRLSIRPDDRWNVRYLNKDNNEEHEEIFDYVMVCIGHHRYPRTPKYIGMDKFTNKQIHSHLYRRASDYENKRVLVVGCGNSGMDISVELSSVASQVFLCARRGYLPWILPRRLFGHLSADQLATRFFHYLPVFLKNWLIEFIANYTVGPHPQEFKPKTPPSANHPTVKSDFLERVAIGTIILKPNITELKADNSIEFVDGSVIENIDVIIYATGYDFVNFSFLDKEIVSGGKEVENQFGNEEYKENLVWLYKFIFPPRITSIAFIGLVQAIGAIMPVSDLQAQYATSFWTGNLSKTPTPIEMEKDIKKTQDIIRKRYYHSARHTIQADMIPYMDELAKDMGCLPYPSKVLFKFGPKLWKLVLFGVPTPIHYRLLGRQSWDVLESPWSYSVDI